MNDEAQELVDAVVRRFGKAAFAVEPSAGDPQADPGSVVLICLHPTRAGHRVEVIQRGNTFEVAYSDGLPPGPAERLFVFAGSGQRREAVGALVVFLEGLFAGRVVVYRERLNAVAKLLRRRDCDDLLWFAAAEEITPRKRRGITALYDWSTD